MRLTLINPELENVNLIKEGAIPYYLYKYFGYKVTIVSYKNGDYPYADTLVKGVDIRFITKNNVRDKKTDRSLVNILRGSVVRYIKENFNNIDILHLTGFSKETLVYAYIFKKYNKNGIVYVKADTDYGIAHIDYLENFFKRNLLKNFFNKVDLYSVESSPVLKYFHEKYKNILTGLISRPIPFLYFGPLFEDVDTKKEKIILTVARLGSHQKNSELLVRAFIRLNQPDWSLVLIGSYDEEFNEWISRVLAPHPEVKKRVRLLGSLEDREELFDWYRRSAIFCLPSRHESFGIALLEASANGCFPITTGVMEIPAAFDILNNWKFGKKVISEDENDLLRCLQASTDSRFEVERVRISKELKSYIEMNFNTYKIVEFLDRTLRNALDSVKEA